MLHTLKVAIMGSICCKNVQIVDNMLQNWEQYVAPYFRRVFKVAKIMLHAHTHYYAAALGGKVTVLQSLVITPTLHLKSKIDKNTGPV